MKRSARTPVPALLALLLGSAALLGVLPPDAAHARQPGEGWLVRSLADLQGPPPSVGQGDELGTVRALVAKRTIDDVERIHWWNVGGPAYRWNQIAVDAMLDDFVTTLPATRNLALLHAAIDDAVAAAWAIKRQNPKPRPATADPSIAAAIALPQESPYPSDHAAAAAAAAAVLAYLLPARSDAFNRMAEEATRARLLAGLEYPGDIAAGRALGGRAATLAIARGKADGADRQWTGSVPQGPGRWQGDSPIAPLAGTWTPWVLSRGDEFRPPAPPTFNSSTVSQALAELKHYKRTPASNHRAVYWEVFGGARAFALWNEIARLGLLEHGAAFDAPASARVFAILNIAYQDATIACFDAKYTYWYIRPSQLDPELKPLFPPPNHPSYPAAHGCLSTAAATVLAGLFPRDRERLQALATQAAEARIWAGIHYRFDIEAGAAIGRAVAQKVLERASAMRKP
jgi:membrane-associated phospholipid phosphatase